MRRRGTSSIAANPVLIGAATTLVVIVAVFLAYNANTGLPFVPTYQLKVEVPDAAQLVKGNDVRIGGTRVGAIDGITVKSTSNDEYIAVLNLKLETSVRPLPKDSTVIVRPRSVLGLKYLQITEGNPASGGFEDGATVPVTQARPEPVEIDDVFNTFDAPTRAAAQKNLKEFGDAFAGRGQDINLAIFELNPLLKNLVPVMRNLSSRRTRLAALFPALGRTAAEIAPVALAQGELFADLDRTFTALASVSDSIQESIAEGPETLDVATRELPLQRPFLQNTTRLFAALRPGAAALKVSAPTLADAVTAGVPAVQRAPQLNRRLGPVFKSLQAFAADPRVPRGLSRLTETVGLLDPILASLAPAQVRCNYVTLFLRNTASLLSEGDDTGTWQRFIIIAAPQGPNNEGSPSSAPANGPQIDNHLHVNPYPNVGAPGQPKECEAGNEPFQVGQTVIGNSPGTQSSKTEVTKPTRSSR